jgi:hypothetical protein
MLVKALLSFMRYEDTGCFWHSEIEDELEMGILVNSMRDVYHY